MTLEMYGLEIKNVYIDIDSMDEQELIAYAKKYYRDDEAINMFLYRYENDRVVKIKKKTRTGTSGTLILRFPEGNPMWLRLIRQRIKILERGLLYRNKEGTL